MPVIRIDYKGRIIYANKAAFPLLREWNCLANDYIPDQLVHEHPALLDLDANFDIEINTPMSSYKLDIIGFNEAGYIGMYGYSIKNKTEKNNAAA